MTRRVADVQVPLAGVPDGLAAYPIEELRDDGVVVRTRRGRAKLSLVELRSVDRFSDGSQLDPSDERFVLGAHRRRWATVEQRYGADAWRRAVDLARAGVITVRCGVDDATRIGAPVSWELTERWGETRAEQRSTTEHDARLWAERAEVVAAEVSADWPELAVALRAARPTSPILPVLVYGAEDLSTGVSHSGPRAFSQAHFGDTKARDDAHKVLDAAGVPEAAIVALGLRRSDRLGLGGPVTLRVGDRAVDLVVLDGPILIRIDQPDLVVELRPNAPLVIVENLQAAEVVADRFPAAALVYTAGLLGPGVLQRVGELAARAQRVLVATDADAGGVRITEQVLAVAPGAVVLDAGEYGHAERERWAADGAAMASLRRSVAGPAVALAEACLRRGYPVEQESSIVEAVSEALPERPHRGSGSS